MKRAAWLCLVGLIACGETDLAALGGADGATGLDGSGPDTAVAEAAAGAVDGSAEASAAGADAAAAPCSPAQQQACDDGLECTYDSCIAGQCAWKIAGGHCLIDGLCWPNGAVHPKQPCLGCHHGLGASAWTPFAKVPCDDGMACTYEDQCDSGKCLGKPLTCDDANPCTGDLCDAKLGCSYPPLAAPCDDGDACTSGDACVGGSCKGKTKVCDDGNTCTVDSCAPKTACANLPADVTCDDQNACTVGDLCKGGTCQPGATPNCDDGNTCSLDSCEAGVGCYHLPVQGPCCVGQTSKCDDGNPCTNDLCAGSGCKHEPNVAPCDDKNACTLIDLCTSGTCQPGAANKCDDGSPCTLDSCDVKAGCTAKPANDGLACNDGAECTKNDTCKSGKCQGIGQCACTPTFAPEASKLTQVLIGDGGKPGEGLDLDDNPKTCAPKDQCSGGIDNAMGGLAGIANAQLQKAVDSGSLSLVLEYQQWKQGPIALALYAAKLDAGNVQCDILKAKCFWRVDGKMIDPQTCKATVALDGTLVGTQLKAGGKGTDFPFAIPIQGGLQLKVTIKGARLQGTIKLAGTKVEALDAILGGAVAKSELLAAIDALPEQGLPLPKDVLKSLLDSLVENDMDTDGDGKVDAASIALKLKGIPAALLGTY
jgi:hypothetical protein